MSRDTPALAALIRAGQVRLIYAQGVPLVGGAALAAAATMLFPWWAGFAPLPWAWLAALVGVSAARILLIAAWRRAEPDAADAARWGRRFSAGTFSAGCLWSAWAVANHDPDQLAFLLLLSTVFAGMVAVSAASAGAHPPSFLSFSVPLALPLAGLHVLSGRAELVLTGVLLALFLVVNVALALRVGRHHAELIRTRCRNDELMARLAGEKRIAEQAVEAKGRFLAAASHDLRQPLHALVLFVEALRREVHDGGRRTLVDDIASSTDALKGLLDSLLDLSRLDADTVAFEPRHVRLDDLFDGLRTRFEPQAAARGLALTVRAPGVAVHVDPMLLERVLGNLLSNALRYTERGGVRLECLPGPAGTHRIDVTDTGIGIPDAAREEVFGEYVQLGNPSRDRERGLGLGLSIVRRLCTLMDVALDMESEVGAGTRVGLRVRAGRLALVAPDPGPARPARADGALVLVVDDELAVRRATGRLLESRGCTALLAGSAREALRAVALAGRDPDLVLSDLRLGDGECGIDAIAALREATSPDLPAVVVTGDTCPARLREIGASGLEALCKPVAPGTLDAVLTRLPSANEPRLRRASGRGAPRSVPARGSTARR